MTAASDPLFPTRDALSKPARKPHASNGGVRPVYPGEGLTVRLLGERFQAEGEALELTPGGMAVRVEFDRGEPPQPDDVIVVEHTGRRTMGIRHEAIVVRTTESATDHSRQVCIELRLDGAMRLRPNGDDRRSCERYACTTKFPAMAWALSPIFFRERIAFRVDDVSRGGATLAVLGGGGAGLFPGVDLDLRVTLFPLGDFDVRGRIASLRPGGSGERSRAGVLWIDPASAFLEALAEYLLQGGLTPARLRQGGFGVRRIERVATYDYAASVEDYEAVLDLQLRAHQNDGRFLDGTRADMVSPVDPYSLHVTCRIGGRIVGYTRATPICGDASRSLSTLAGHVIPDWLWKEGFVEAHGVAIDPEFQRVGLLVPLVQHLVRIACESGCQYLLGGCEDALLPVYEQMGFFELEKRLITPKAGWSFASHLFCLDVRQIVGNPGQGKWTRDMASAIAFVSGEEWPSSGVVVSGTAISETAAADSGGPTAAGR